MDRDELDEIMQEYVKSTNGDVNKDLAKLDLSRFEESKARARAKSRQNKMWAGVAAMVVLIIALSVALPLTLTSGPDGPDVFYLNASSVERVEMESLQDVTTEVTNDVLLPQISFVECATFKLLNDKSIIGAYFNGFIYDEIVNDLMAYILIENIELDSLSDYKTLENNYKWESIKVEYSIMLDSANLINSYIIKFNANGFNHYYTITTGSEIEIGELLDWVFG